MQPVMKAKDKVHYIYTFSRKYTSAPDDKFCFFYVETDVDGHIPFEFDSIRASAPVLLDEEINQILEFKPDGVVIGHFTYRLTKQPLSLS